MRRPVHLPGDDAHDLLQFFHEVRLDVQTAGRVHDDHVDAPRHGRLHAVERNRGGITAGLVANA